MSKSKRQKLQDKFPIFYGSLRYGFECGVGWYELLKELGEKVEPILEKEDAEPLYEKGYKIDGQYMHERLVVKEKFGMLCVQYPEQFDVSDEALEKIKEHIKWAEEKSKNTCEICGVTENLVDRGFNPICEECSEKDFIKTRQNWEGE